MSRPTTPRRDLAAFLAEFKRRRAHRSLIVYSMQWPRVQSWAIAYLNLPALRLLVVVWVGEGSIVS